MYVGTLYYNQVEDMPTSEMRPYMSVDSSPSFYTMVKL